MKTVLTPIIMMMTMFCVPAQADNADRVARFVPGTDLVAARQMLTRYLNGSTAEATKTELENLHLRGISALSMALDVIAEAAENKNQSDQHRIEWSLKLVRFIALRTSQSGTFIPEEARRQLSLKLVGLLREYQHKQVSLQQITDTYDFLGLWSPHELWFLAPRAGKMGGLIHYYTYLVNMVPILGDEGRKALEENIRSIAPKQLVPYMALRQMGFANASDYETLFRLYAHKFGEAFHSHAIGNKWSAAYSPTAYRDYEDTRMMSFYNESMNLLRLDAKNSPVVAAAYERAKASIERSESQDGQGKLRALFFRYFESDTPDIMRQETIRALAEGSLRNGEFVLPEPFQRREVNPVTPASYVVPQELRGKVISLGEVRARLSCSRSHSK